LYYHVNGAWVTGTPGSGNGIPLVQGKEIGPACGAQALSAAKCSAESPGLIQPGKSTLARDLSARRSRQDMFPSRANKQKAEFCRHKRME
jgi:hypothetical protein